MIVHFFRKLWKPQRGVARSPREKVKEITGQDMKGSRGSKQKAQGRLIFLREIILQRLDEPELVQGESPSRGHVGKLGTATRHDVRAFSQGALRTALRVTG